MNFFNFINPDDSLPDDALNDDVGRQTINHWAWLWSERLDERNIQRLVPQAPLDRVPLYLRNYEPHGIRNVWRENIVEEFTIIKEIVKDYRYIAMDTEFPGVVARPSGDYDNHLLYEYETLRCNVDVLKLIQIGLTFMNVDGRLPPGPCHTWQFNLYFDVRIDMHAQDSIELLRQSGISFDQHIVRGIPHAQFAQLIFSSGCIFSNHITWLTFHSSYDFAYLLKMFIRVSLPATESEFLDLLKKYFPHFYDLKHVMSSCRIRGGLQDLSNHLGVERMGMQHQAGSDALVTGRAYFKLRDRYFNGVMNASFCGILYGFSPLDAAIAAETAANSAAGSSASSASGSSVPYRCPTPPGFH